MTTDFERKKQRHASGESTVSTISTYIPVPPDGGYGWIIVIASFFNHVIVDGITFTFGVFYPQFIDFFGEGRAHTALVGSLQAGCYFLGAPIASALINKYGCRSVCIFGAIMASLAFVIGSFSTSLNFLMVTYGIIGGFGLGFIYLPSIISVTYYFHRRRAFATGIACCGAGVGTFLFAPLGQFLMDTLDWRSAMIVEAAILLNTSLFGMMLRPLSPAKKPRRPRRKNFIDRIKEKAMVITEDEESTDIGKTTALVEKAKIAREELIKQEEELSDTDVKTNGYAHPIPSITVDEHHETNEHKETSALISNGHTVPPVDRRLEFLKSNGEKLPTTTSLPAGINVQVRLEDKSGHNNVSKRSSSIDTSRRAMSCSTADAKALKPRKKTAGQSLKVESTRPMYRKDIFLSGSLLNVVQFRSTNDVKSFMRSITSVPQIAVNENESDSKFNRLFHISAAVKHVFREMLDLSLCADPVFVIAGLSNAFGMFALFLPFIYIVDRAVSLQVPLAQAAFLLSIIGITNTIGRVGTGFLADLPRVNALVLHNSCLLIMGLVCMLMMFCRTYVLMCIAAITFGFGMAGWISLTSIILCNLMGLEKLTNAFGLLTMIRGIAVICGPPVAGILYEQTLDYDITFQIGGITMLISGLLFCSLHLPCFASYRKDLQTVDDMEMPNLEFTDDFIENSEHKSDYN